MTNSLMWFRYDLRIKDNEAFFAALKNQNCLPIFIFDHGFLKLGTTSNFHLSFLNDSLIDLNNNLKKEYNTSINCYKGKTIEILDHLIKNIKLTIFIQTRYLKENILVI